MIRKICPNHTPVFMVAHGGKKVSLSREAGGRTGGDRGLTLNYHLHMNFPQNRGREGTWLNSSETSGAVT